ncbi:hypothetical protein B0H17DRAFT_1148100 [Mycena rosella]|uniref:Uncharacterized protein n=1 Tax=Mycena rosella TaxID=1033263 RepID=A0AAD7CGY8_MYCRO|nr:hypothetical protein B0H17DRAFT_1148100 [Mycena rosella]
MVEGMEHVAVVGEVLELKNQCWEQSPGRTQLTCLWMPGEADLAVAELVDVEPGHVVVEVTESKELSHRSRDACLVVLAVGETGFPAAELAAHGRAARFRACLRAAGVGEGALSRHRRDLQAFVGSGDSASPAKTASVHGRHLAGLRGVPPRWGQGAQWMHSQCCAAAPHFGVGKGFGMAQFDVVTRLTDLSLGRCASEDDDARGGDGDLKKSKFEVKLTPGFRLSLAEVFSLRLSLILIVTMQFAEPRSTGNAFEPGLELLGNVGKVSARLSITRSSDPVLPASYSSNPFLQEVLLIQVMMLDNQHDYYCRLGS